MDAKTYTDNRIAVREIPERGITVTADAAGMVYVNGIPTSTPITAQGLTFVWAPRQANLPSGVKITLDAAAVAKITAHSAAYVAARRELARKERAYDAFYNEGGEGYNPYR